MVIHHDSCKNMTDVRTNPDKCIPIIWNSKQEGLFESALDITVESYTNIIATIAAAVTEADATIERLFREEKDAKTSIIRLELMVRDRQHLAAVLRIIRHQKQVNKVNRCKT